MQGRSAKVCIVNSFGNRPNFGGPIGVFREAFSKVNGENWEIRTYDEVARGTALIRKIGSRTFGPWRSGYSRTCNLHSNLSHDAAYFPGIPGIFDYPAVWFSDLFQYFACRPLMKPGQKAVLQLHHPTLPSIEAQEQPWHNAEDRQLIARIERWALQDADLVVLANAGAETIYGDLLARTPVAYLQNAMAGHDAGEVPVLSTAHTNFLYVGRRIRLKGFDILIEAFRQAHAIEPALRLYLLGDGEPCVHPGVVDLQFSKVPSKWIAASDCVIIPNRSSYLDLNLLETLSLGRPVMMTCTEGHTMFSEAGPEIYPIADATIEVVRDAMLAAPDWLAGIKGKSPSNREIFEREFALDGFAGRLDEICEGILSERAG